MCHCATKKEKKEKKMKNNWMEWLEPRKQKPVSIFYNKLMQQIIFSLEITRKIKKKKQLN